MRIRIGEKTGSDSMQRNEQDSGCYLEESWIDLREQIITLGAGSRQIADMRMMFFCGAVALYDLIHEVLQSKPNPDSVHTMQSIHTELEAFMAERFTGFLDS